MRGYSYLSLVSSVYLHSCSLKSFRIEGLLEFQRDESGGIYWRMRMDSDGCGEKNQDVSRRVAMKFQIKTVTESFKFFPQLTNFRMCL